MKGPKENTYFFMNKASSKTVNGKRVKQSRPVSGDSWKKGLNQVM